MVRVSGNNIYLTKGDSLNVVIKLTYADGTEYEPVENDYLRFAVKEDFEDEEPIILKEIPVDTMLLSLEPVDTEFLEQPCSLWYDIEMTFADGTVCTVIPKSRLYICEEVH